MATTPSFLPGITSVESTTSTLKIQAQMLQEMLDSGKFDKAALKSLLDTFNKITKILKETPTHMGDLFKKGLGDFKSDFGKALEKILKDVDGAGKTYHQLETLADNSLENLQVTAEMLEFAKKDHDLMEKIQKGLESSSAENAPYLKAIAGITKRETQQRAKETEKAFLGGMAHKLVDSFAPLKLLTTIVGRARGKDVESTSEFWKRTTGIGKGIRDRADADREKATFARSAGILGQEWGIEGLEQSTLEQMKAEKKNRIGMMAEKFRLSNQLLMGGPNYETAASAMMKKSRPQEVGGLPMVIGDQQKALVVVSKTFQEKAKLDPTASDLIRHPGALSEGFLYLGKKNDNIIKAIKGQDIDIEGGGGGGAGKGLLGDIAGKGLSEIIAKVLPSILPMIGKALVTIVTGPALPIILTAVGAGLVAKIFVDNDKAGKEYEKMLEGTSEKPIEEQKTVLKGKLADTKAQYSQLMEGRKGASDKYLKETEDLKKSLEEDIKKHEARLEELGVTDYSLAPGERDTVSKSYLLDDSYEALSPEEYGADLMAEIMGASQPPAEDKKPTAPVTYSNPYAKKTYHTGGVVPGINKNIPATLRSGEVVLSPAESSGYKDKISSLGKTITNLEKLNMQKVEELLIKLNEVTARSNERIVGAIENNTNTIGSKLDSKATNENIPLSKEKISSF